MHAGESAHQTEKTLSAAGREGERGGGRRGGGRKRE